MLLEGRLQGKVECVYTLFLQKSMNAKFVPFREFAPDTVKFRV